MQNAGKGADKAAPSEALVPLGSSHRCFEVGWDGRGREGVGNKAC